MDAYNSPDAKGSSRCIGVKCFREGVPVGKRAADMTPKKLERVRKCRREWPIASPTRAHRKFAPTLRAQGHDKASPQTKDIFNGPNCFQSEERALSIENMSSPT